MVFLSFCKDDGPRKGNWGGGHQVCGELKEKKVLARGSMEVRVVGSVHKGGENQHISNKIGRSKAHCVGEE